MNLGETKDSSNRGPADNHQVSLNSHNVDTGVDTDTLEIAHMISAEQIDEQYVVGVWSKAKLKPSGEIYPEARHLRHQSGQEVLPWQQRETSYCPLIITIAFRSQVGR